MNRGQHTSPRTLRKRLDANSSGIPVSFVLPCDMGVHGASRSWPAKSSICSYRSPFSGSGAVIERDCTPRRRLEILSWTRDSTTSPHPHVWRAKSSLERPSRDHNPSRRQTRVPARLATQVRSLLLAPGHRISIVQERSANSQIAGDDRRMGSFVSFACTIAQYLLMPAVADTV
jgi:hypothetical protein